MPPVKDLSKLSKEDLLNKCRKLNLPVGTLTKKSRTSLECKVRTAMNEERGKKFSDLANKDIKAKVAASEPETPKSVRPSRIPVMMRSSSSGGRTPPSPRAIFEDPNDSGIQLTSAPIGTNADGIQGTLNQWASLQQLRRSLMEDLKEFEENEFVNPDQVKEDEIPVPAHLERQSKAELNLNESEDEDEEDDGHDDFNNVEENHIRNHLLPSKWVSAALALVTGIILYNVWEIFLY